MPFRIRVADSSPRKKGEKVESRDPGSHWQTNRPSSNPRNLPFELSFRGSVVAPLSRLPLTANPVTLLRIVDVHVMSPAGVRNEGPRWLGPNRLSTREGRRVETCHRGEVSPVQVYYTCAWPLHRNDSSACPFHGGDKCPFSLVATIGRPRLARFHQPAIYLRPRAVNSTKRLLPPRFSLFLIIC